MLRYGSMALILLHWMRITTASGLQIYFYGYPPAQIWRIEGLATWINTSSFSQNLDCNTSSNNGAHVGWTRQAGLNPNWVQSVTNGKRLTLDSFTNPSYLGIYTCYDSETNESLNVNITSANPAIQAVSDVTIEAGSSGHLKVYVSGVPDPVSTDITWFKLGPGGNTTELKEPTVNFSSDHRTLLLTDVQERDGGTYICSVSPTNLPTAIVTIYVNVILPGSTSATTCIPTSTAVPTSVTMATSAITPNNTNMPLCSTSCAISSCSFEVPFIAISVALSSLFLVSLVVNGVLLYKWLGAAQNKPKSASTAVKFDSNSTEVLFNSST